jgi:hypothetical protein
MINPSNFLSGNNDIVGNATSGIIDAFSPQQKVNAEFMNRNPNINTQMKRIGNISNTLSSIGLKSGNPIAMGVGAALKIGSGLSNSAKDEFGVVKDSGKAIIGAMLNPIEGISTLLNQSEIKDSKKRFVNTEINKNIVDTAKTGNAISNSIPQYQAPGYGKLGMKLKTKFSSRNGKSKF